MSPGKDETRACGYIYIYIYILYIPLYRKQKFCQICNKTFSEYDDNKKYHKVRNHWNI